MSNKITTFQSINGDSVIGFTSMKEMKNLKYLDAPKMAAYMMDGENSHRKHLGLINLFATTHQRTVPFMRNLFEKAAVLETTPDQIITYDLPVDREDMACYTTGDTSAEQDKPGIDETVFAIELSEEFTKGDILTYDPMYGEQLIISEDHEVEPIGDAFRHYAYMVTQDKTKFFPLDKLKPGIEYIKLTNVIGEYGTNYSSINLIKPASGTITNEFLLGDPRGVETFYTGKASRMKHPGFSDFTDKARKDAVKRLEQMGGSNSDMFFTAKASLNAEGKVGFDPNTVTIGATLEYLALAELTLMESGSLLFSKAGSFRTNHGTKMINEGAWHQIRRGKIISYPKAGGITFNHIRKAVQYVYKNSNIPVLKRRVKFRVGSMAHANMMQLFREESLQQVKALPEALLGTDAQIPKVFSGSLDNLHMEAIMITSVVVPGIGTIEVELDESLDYQPLSDRFSAGFYGSGYAHTAYSMVIEDATNPEYTNVNDVVDGAELVEGGSSNANIYYVKPEGDHLVYGYEQGRTANEGNSRYVQSSLKQMARTFWAHSTSASLVLDTTRYVVIELQR